MIARYASATVIAARAAWKSLEQQGMA